MKDHRSDPRRSAQMPASLSSTDINVACTIVDISDKGAKLKLRPGYFLSKACYLQISDLGRTVLSHVVWRTRTEAGVSFSEALSDCDGKDAAASGWRSSNSGTGRARF